MRTHQSKWSRASGWERLPATASSTPPNLVLIFGSRLSLCGDEALPDLARHYPLESLHGCSTAGEIEGTRVHDDTVVATALWFDRGHVETARCTLAEAPDGEALGRRLAGLVPHAGLSHVFVLSDGTQVNGSELARGLAGALPPGVTLSGGLSGDGAAFGSTVVCHAGQVASSTVSRSLANSLAERESRTVRPVRACVASW